RRRRRASAGPGRAPAPGARPGHPGRPGRRLRGRPPGGDRGAVRAAGAGAGAGRRERALTTGEGSLRLWALGGLPEVRPGDDLPGMLAEAAGAGGMAPGDVLVVAHKVVSKADGRL